MSRSKKKYVKMKAILEAQGSYQLRNQVARDRFKKLEEEGKQNDNRHR